MNKITKLELELHFKKGYFKCNILGFGKNGQDQRNGFIDIKSRLDEDILTAHKMTVIATVEVEETGQVFDIRYAFTGVEISKEHTTVGNNVRYTFRAETISLGD